MNPPKMTDEIRNVVTLITGRRDVSQRDIRGTWETVWMQRGASVASFDAKWRPAILLAKEMAKRNKI